MEYVIVNQAGAVQNVKLNPAEITVIIMENA